MAATAKKIQEIDEIEEVEVPEGGIGDFVMDDDEAEAIYGKDEDEDEDFGDTGIAQFPEIAKKMATYGRNEDKFLAHVAKGELVIPFQFLENEDTKNRIFEMLIEAGLEDPERYVVGGDSNSINPTTGLPEFFLGKIFKSIVGGVKSAFKSVVKVVKKLAPIILPIALAATGLGPVYGAAMGSGISTLINGGDIGDALKSSLIAGATGAAYAGATGGMKGVADAFADPSARFSQAFENTKSSFSDFLGKSDPTANVKVDASEFKFKPQEATQQLNSNVTPTAGMNESVDKLGETVNSMGRYGRGLQTADSSVALGPETSFLDLPFDEQVTRAGDLAFRGGETEDNILIAKDAAEKKYLDNALSKGIAPLQTSIDAARAAAGPGMLARYGPSVLAGTALAAGAGAFEVPEQEPVNLAGRNPDGTVITGSDLIEADPSKYLISELGNIRLNPETGEYEDIVSTASSMYTAPTSYAAMPAMSPNDYLRGSVPSGPFARPYVQAAAEGGPIFPRRNGGIAPTEGVAGQDSVRAMLMPGEFVMTTDAVRGLGNGNLNSGIQNMYSVMRNLESRGRNTA